MTESNELLWPLKDEAHAFIIADFYYILTERQIKQHDCTARQCSPLRRKCMECSINSPALPLLMKLLVIGQRLKTPNFSAFHWSPRGSLVSIGQHFVATREYFTEKYRNKFNYRIGPKRT